MITFNYFTDKKTPLYEQLYRFIKEDILSGRLKAGEKLPSKRNLAAHLGISTITIENSYAQLADEGYIFSKARSGFYVSDVSGLYKLGRENPTNSGTFASAAGGDDAAGHRHSEPACLGLSGSASSGAEKLTGLGSTSPLDPEKESPIIADFSGFSPEKEGFPFSVWARMMRETISEKSEKLMEKSEGRGIRELRLAIAKQLYEYRGMRVDADSIVIGAGTEYLYSLLIQLLGRDKCYCVEDPGYKTIEKVYRLNNVIPVYAGLDEEGILVNPQRFREKSGQPRRCSDSFTAGDDKKVNAAGWQDARTNENGLNESQNTSDRQGSPENESNPSEPQNAPDRQGSLENESKHNETQTASDRQGSLENENHNEPQNIPVRQGFFADEDDMNKMQNSMGRPESPANEKSPNEAQNTMVRLSLSETPAQIVHISPTHHFPTGITMPVTRRYELLNWALKKEDRYIIEDDYDSEFRLSGRPIPALKSIDAGGRVIYMNTFSKSLASTIRISYMVLPDKLNRLFEEKLGFLSCTVSTFEQYTLAKFMSEGHFEKHINRRRLYYSRKREELIRAIKQSPLSEKATIIERDLGLHFLLRFDTALSDRELQNKLKKRGIIMIPLSEYYASPGKSPDSHEFILNYTGRCMTGIGEILNIINDCLSG